MAHSPECRVCLVKQHRRDMGENRTCLSCWRVFDNIRGIHGTFYGHREFLEQPSRIARIELYAARAELNLPLFDGVTTED
jgi:hypothetical protein